MTPRLILAAALALTPFATQAAESGNRHFPAAANGPAGAQPPYSAQVQFHSAETARCAAEGTHIFSSW